MKLKYERVADFMRLFTEEELKQWRGKDNKAPSWVVEGICWFMDQDPGHQELMKRLKESGD